jgi:hypothetical protein
MAPQGPLSHWNDRTKYFYRKLAGLRNQPLIDKIDECFDILRGKKPLTPPYDRNDTISIIRVIRHILQDERNIDLGLARQMYEELMKEVEGEMKQP